MKCDACVNSDRQNSDRAAGPYMQRKPLGVCLCVCVCARAGILCVCARRLCACVCARAHSAAVFARHRVRVRRARHVIERNPPPETRGSEGDSFAYKASDQHLPRAVAKPMKTSARSSPRETFFLPNYRFAFPFGYNHWGGNPASRCKSQSWRRCVWGGERETHLRSCT